MCDEIGGYEILNGSIKIDNIYESYCSDTTGSESTLLETREMINLAKELFELFNVSQYYNKYKNPKRIDKDDIRDMFYLFRSKLENNYTDVQYFISYCEFFNLKYESLYNIIMVIDRENILKELGDTYGNTFFKNNRTKKLF